MDSGIILSPYKPIEIQNSVCIELMNFIKDYDYLFSRLEMSPMSHIEMIRGLFNMTLCYSEYYDNVKLAEELYIIYVDRFPERFISMSCIYIFSDPMVLQNYYLTSRVYEYIIDKDELAFVKALKEHRLDYRKYINYFKGDKDAIQSLFNCSTNYGRF